MKQGDVVARPVVTFEGTPRQESGTRKVIPFPAPERTNGESTVVEWTVGGNHGKPAVKLTEVSSGFGHVMKASLGDRAA